MKNVLKHVIVSVVILGFSSITEATDWSRLVNDPNYLINEVRKAEAKLLNVTAEIEVWADERAHKNDSWQKNPLLTLSSRVRMDGDPKGKIRIEVKGEKSVWHREDGDVVLEEDYSLAFDGKQGMELNSRELRDGKEINIRPRGRIWPDKPRRLDSGSLIFASGRRFTMNHSLTDEQYDVCGNSFSGLLELSKKAQQRGELGYEISTEQYAGLECIKISTPSSVKNVLTESWRLDPNRAFLLVGHEDKHILRDGRKWIIADLKVTKAVEAAPGVWFPVEATVLSAGPSFSKSWNYRKTFYKAKNVQVNIAGLDEKTYRISFPEGARVVTEVSN